MFQPAGKVRKFFKVALFGDKKNGKTKFALSFPKPKVIDSERGTVLFADEYQFDVADANHWRELGPALDELEKNPAPDGTLVIDSATVFYKDLIDEVLQDAANKRGIEAMTQFHWGVVKNRWARFMNRLVDLNMNTVLVVRESEEYEDFRDPNTGELKSRKTGHQRADIEKSTLYTFDFIIQMKAEIDKKSKKVVYKAVIDGSRRKELPKFKEFDVTDKNPYDIIFKPIEHIVQAGKMMERRDAPITVQKDQPKPAAEKKESKKKEAPVKDKTEAERLEEIKNFGQAPGANLAGPHLPDSPVATDEELKVLMTRANQLQWPDGSKFASKDGKAMIHKFFSVESTKDLRKFQVDFLYGEFGDVIAGRKEFARDEEGVPFIRAKAAGPGEGSATSTPAAAVESTK